MSTDRCAVFAGRRGPATIALFLLALLSAVQAACTRDDVAAAVATMAVEMQTTLEPWGATAQANAASLTTRVPSALATAKGPAPTSVFEFVIVSPTHPGSPGDETDPSIVLLPVESPAPPTATAPPTAMPQPTETPTPLPSPTPLPTEIEKDGGLMRLVSGGFFQMGAASDDLMTECQQHVSNCRLDWFTPSEPQHAVLVGAYYLDVYEVTNERFSRFLNSQGGDVSNSCLGQPCLDTAESRIAVQPDGTYAASSDVARRPATGVTWYGAAAFCAWHDARLPTEAEWEKAARWDDAAAVARLYPWGDTFDGRRLSFCDANCDAPQANMAYNDGYGATAPVGTYEDGRSPSGLYDMAGNVWEWVADWYAPDYYGQSPGAAPTGPLEGEEKVVRGGSWFDTAYFTMPAVRFPSAPGNADGTIGFRCAADTP